MRRLLGSSLVNWLCFCCILWWLYHLLAILTHSTHLHVSAGRRGFHAWLCNNEGPFIHSVRWTRDVYIYKSMVRHSIKMLQVLPEPLQFIIWKLRAKSMSILMHIMMWLGNGCLPAHLCKSKYPQLVSRGSWTYKGPQDKSPLWNQWLGTKLCGFLTSVNSFVQGWTRICVGCNVSVAC